MRTKTLTLVAAMVGFSLVLTACGANSSTPGGTAPSNSAVSAPAGGGGSGKVGVILPETATSARWEGFDKPMLQKALTDQGFTVDIQNAQGDVQKFSTLADGMIAQGVKVLIIAAINGEVGSAVAAKSRKTRSPSPASSLASKSPNPNAPANSTPRPPSKTPSARSSSSPSPPTTRSSKTS